MLTVKPFLIRGPQNQTAVTGSSIVFQCRVGGEPLPDVLWRRTASGGNMPLGETHCLTNHLVDLINNETTNCSLYKIYIIVCKYV